MYRISILLTAFLLLSSFQASALTNRIYMSPMESSRWVVSKNSPVACEIEHVIPRFGKAIFSQQSGRSLELRIETHHPFKKDMEMAFRSVTANWKGIHVESELAVLKSSGGHRLVDVTSNTARHAYFELQQGYQPSLFFVDEDDGLKPVSVILSTVNFRDVEAEFGDCLTTLHPYHFDDVKLARVHFDFDEEFPHEDEEVRALSKILAYLKVDDSVNTLVISGHTDFKGSVCYNETLSARRAWYVYDYLVQHGVDPKKLQVKFHGESRPLAKGRDDRSRAMNRRVTVSMQK